MAYRINPSFDRFPTEARLVGLILSSFGELELSICQAANAAIQSEDYAVLKALYRLRTTSSRIDVAVELMQPIYCKFELDAAYSTAVGMVGHCLRIRNQYAHCNWADHYTAGLFFADLQTSARNKHFDHYYKHVDPPLLQQQYEFFAISLDWLRYADNLLAQKTGMSLGLVWSKPPESTPPPLHNPASAHIPPWLTKELQEAHLKRSLEIERNDHQVERPPSVLRLTREEWAAKDAKDARLAAERNLDQGS